MERESQQGSFPSYYSILGVGIDSSADDIRRAYRKLAMQWHPDRWTRTPSLLSEAKRKFQQIQEAYSVLSDQRKRSLYDVGLYDPDEEEDEGFCDFVEEMMSLMDQNKDKKYSMDELQTMLVEMAQGFEFSSWPCGPTVVGDSGYSESMRWNSDLLMGRNSQFDTSKWQMYGTGSYCLHNLIPQSGRCVEQAVIADRRRGTRNNLDNSSSYKTPKLSNSAFF